MNVVNLMNELGEAWLAGTGGDGETLVVAQGEGIPPLAIKSVRAETHDDADGSHTIWLEVEEM